MEQEIKASHSLQHKRRSHDIHTGAMPGYSLCLCTGHQSLRSPIGTLGLLCRPQHRVRTKKSGVANRRLDVWRFCLWRNRHHHRPLAITIPSVPAEILPVQCAERMNLGSLCSLQFFWWHRCPLESRRQNMKSERHCRR